MNWSITSKAIESIIKNFQTGPDGFTGKFFQTFKEDLITSLLKCFPKTEDETMCPNTFYEAVIILTPKPHENTRTPCGGRGGEPTYASIFLMNINAKVVNKILANWIQQHIERLILNGQVVFSKDASTDQHSQTNQCDIPYEQNER